MERIITVINDYRSDAGFLDNLLFSHLRRLQAVRKVRDLLKTISDKKLLRLWGQAVIERAGRRWQRIMTHGPMTDDLCTLCRRECQKREDIDTGESKWRRQNQPRYHDPKKCWEAN